MRSHIPAAPTPVFEIVKVSPTAPVTVTGAEPDAQSIVALAGDAAAACAAGAAANPAATTSAAAPMATTDRVRRMAFLSAGVCATLGRDGPLGNEHLT